jgi:hypothetical protein
MTGTGTHDANAHASWSVKDPSIAEVDVAGRVKPLKSGTTEVIATYKSVTASVPVKVVFPEKLVLEQKTLELTEGGEAKELRFQVFDAQGRPLKDRTPTFHSSNKEVVSMGQNAAFPVHAGSAMIDVKIENLVETVAVTVLPEKVAKK